MTSLKADSLQMSLVINLAAAASSLHEARTVCKSKSNLVIGIAPYYGKHHC